MDVPCLLDGRLKLRHLLLVDALNRQGSVVGAAAELHITQPVATRCLHELEQILGAELYERGPRGVTPTIFGDAFTAHARAVITQLAQAGRHVAELADAERGSVIVGTHIGGTMGWLADTIALLKTNHPRVTITVREGPPAQLQVELEAGHIDVMVARVLPPTEQTTTRDIMRGTPCQLVARADHPMADARDLGLRDLIDYPWVLPGRGVAVRRELEDLFARDGIPWPQNLVETSSFLVIYQLLHQTDMIALLPRTVIPATDTYLAPLPVTLDLPEYRLGITLPADRPVNPATQAFIDLVDKVTAQFVSDA
ncbi:LysR substrate-binding domain-containing protein [Nocardia crassostreae]|uniref:LysR substrate-binding domain-containing protein n=1 Tax=Nocardia crassostreae TaxID=53428 RepID=UPI0008295A2A|nr:LysR substrate-binding domain-containing protein [Nocardia crassostreae]